MDYFLLFLYLKKTDSDFFDEEFDEALDDMRVSVWRNKDSSGKPWKGIDSPSQNNYKLAYQKFLFTPLAWQRILQSVTPPVPPNEFTTNEHIALKAFAGGLEATQEFVPDSWLSPGIQMEADQSKSEDVNWTKQRTWRRSLGETVAESRKALLTVLRRQ